MECVWLHINCGIRLVPVPRKRSALSLSISSPSNSALCSTPLSLEASDRSGRKRVKFNEFVSASDDTSLQNRLVGSANRIVASLGSYDQLDAVVVEASSSRTTGSQKTEETKSESTGSAIAINSGSAAGVGLGLQSPSAGNIIKKRDLLHDSDLSGAEILKIKKAKRRRHRKRKSKSQEQKDESTDTSMEIETATNRQVTAPKGASSNKLKGKDKTDKSSRSNGNPKQISSDDEDKPEVTKPRSKKRKAKSLPLPSYDGDENDVGNAIGAKGSSSDLANQAEANNNCVGESDKTHTREFLTPSSIVPIRKGSSFATSSSGYSDGDRTIESSGKRQDTPMLPRVLKNPGFNFDAVRKSLSSNLDKALEKEEATGDSAFEAETSFETLHFKLPGNSVTSANGSYKSVSNVYSCTEKQVDYEKLRNIRSIEEIDVGNVIAFKVELTMLSFSAHLILSHPSCPVIEI
jgi:hypothetical protein